jgi:hypothetical protein
MNRLFGLSLAALLVAAAAPSTAHAAVSDDYGGLINVLINRVGMPCGTVANVIENVDPDLECSLEGRENTYSAVALCARALDNRCVDVSTSDDDGDGWTIGEGDCDDTDGAVYPSAAEVAYDGIDQDCDGADLTDVDGDGYDAQEAGGDDCDDDDGEINPDAEEVADGLDNDCDDSIDEGTDTVTGELVAYYPFSGDADDASGNGNHGTVSGASLTEDVDGESSSAYHFDGNDTITVPLSDSLSSISDTGQITVSAWINVDSWDDGIWFPIVEIEDGWVFHVQSNASTSIGLTMNNVGIGTWDETSESISLSAWHHVAIAYDDAVDLASFYLDGEWIADQEFTRDIPSYSDDMIIGFSPYGSDDYANGTIDELRIYSRALSEEEILDLY